MEIERLTNNADIIAVATLADDSVVPVVWRDRRLGPPPAVSWEIVVTSALIMYRRVRRTKVKPWSKQSEAPAVDRTKPPPDYTVELWVDGWVWWKGVIPSEVRGQILALLHHEPPCICGMENDEAGAIAAAWTSLGQASHLGAKA